jgi:23S rRNA (uracil1939-C5)-methyltransferase
MSMTPGQLVPLLVEKPAAGGRMIARVDRHVVLVSGAIPGERLTARVERIGKGVVYAQALSIEEASADRREPFADPLCGGCLYAHIAYPRQLEIKAQIIADGFARIGRVVLPAPVPVAGSRFDGYRMRARLHVRARRVGFFREGTHEVCDVRATRQLLPATVDVLDRVAAALQWLEVDQVQELEVSENIDASERVVHLDAAAPVDPIRLASVGPFAGLSGLTINRFSDGMQDVSPADAITGDPRSRQSGVVRDFSPAHVVAGEPYVTDRLAVSAHEVTLRRHVLTFFQGNRYLLNDLVAHVVGLVEEGSTVVDLYAGAGLFAVSAAVARGARVTAVEGDKLAALDLEANAVSANRGVVAVHQPVENFTRAAQQRPDTIVLDPPRTGVSREALDGIVGLRAGTIIYVSCDVATLARDSRRLIDAGYVIRRVDAFDLFPNTPHVETVVEMKRV